MTAHSCEQSERAFGKRAPGCPRCLELAQGSPARTGWQGRYFEQKAMAAQVEDAWKRNIQAKGLCFCGKPREHAAVCTASEW